MCACMCLPVCLWLYVCVFVPWSDKKRNERSPKAFQLSPQLTFDCSHGLLSPVLPSSPLLRPIHPITCCLHPRILAVPCPMAADYFAIAAISFHLSEAESVSKRPYTSTPRKEHSRGCAVGTKYSF